MQFGVRRMFLGATAIAVTCLAGAAGAAGQAGAAAPTQGTGEKVPVSEEVFKTITVLKGLPVDNFFESMGMFANAMGNDCTFCHSPKAYFDKGEFATQTPRMQRARQMIVMMNTINKNYFKGEPRVTCFTCHQGSESPRAEPNIMLQYGVPVEDPNIREFPADASFTAEQTFDKYIQALGGAAALSKFTSFAAKGTYAGFDTALGKIAVEMYGRSQKGGAQQATIIHMFNGDSFRTFDGQNGWMAGPDTPMPLVPLTEGNLDRARLEAMVAFPTAAELKASFPQWRTARTAIDDKEVRVVQGIRDGQVLANFYFDESGLLVRVVRWTRTPVGFIPTHIDLSDYRPLAGIKFPYKKVVTQTYMQMTIELSDVQPNANVPASRFGKPAPVIRKPSA